jgi:hypothetical protein
MRETDNECLASKITDDKCLAYTKTRFDDILIKFIHFRVQTDKKNTSFIGVTLHLASDCHNLGTLAPTKSMSVQFL